MKKNSTTVRSAAFTLPEVCVTLGILAAVGGVAYTLLMSSTTLLAKNLSLNASNTTTRTTLDRIFAEINQANLVKPPPPFDPEAAKFPCYLVNADGTPSTPGTGPAAGIVVDSYVGGPYIVGNPGSGLAAKATTFKLYYSTDTFANPPAPVKNDVVIMDGVTRALVDSSSTPTSALLLSRSSSSTQPRRVGDGYPTRQIGKLHESTDYKRQRHFLAGQHATDGLRLAPQGLRGRAWERDEWTSRRTADVPRRGESHFGD